MTASAKAGSISRTPPCSICITELGIGQHVELKKQQTGIRQLGVSHDWEPVLDGYRPTMTKKLIGKHWNGAATIITLGEYLDTVLDIYRLREIESRLGGLLGQEVAHN